MSLLSEPIFVSTKRLEQSILLEATSQRTYNVKRPRASDLPRLKEWYRTQLAIAHLWSSTWYAVIRWVDLYVGIGVTCHLQVIKCVESKLDKKAACVTTVMTAIICNVSGPPSSWASSEKLARLLFRGSPNIDCIIFLKFFRHQIQKLLPHFI